VPPTIVRDTASSFCDRPNRNARGVIDSKMHLRCFGSNTGHCGVEHSQVVRADQTTPVGEYRKICQHRPRIRASAKGAPSDGCTERALSLTPHRGSQKQTAHTVHRKGHSTWPWVRQFRKAQCLSDEMMMRTSASWLWKLLRGTGDLAAPITTPQPGESRNARFASPNRSGFDRCASPATNKPGPVQRR